MSSRSSRFQPSRPALEVVGGGLRVDASRVKRPAMTFAADWADVRLRDGVIELLLGQTDPFEPTFASLLVLMLSRDAWATSLFAPAGSVVRTLRANGTTPRQSPQLDQPHTSTPPVDRRAVDWIALGTGNGFAELICYRLSQHSVHMLLAPGQPAPPNDALIFPEVTVVLPVDRALFVLEHGRDLLFPGQDFPTSA